VYELYHDAQIHEQQVDLHSLYSSIALVKFANQADNQQFVIVGVAKDLQLNPRQVGGGFLYTYKLVNLNNFD
jgi:splicing factor 3B subunit 3